MNDIKQPQGVSRHEFSVKDRRAMSISGVKEILSFDEQNVRMLTVGGELVVDGDSLRVKVLVLEGRIDDVGYVEEHAEGRRGFWSRLIK